MALNRLSTQQMIRVSKQWLSKKELRPRLAGLKRVAPFLDDLEVAHDNLLISRSGALAISPELTVVRDKQAAVDDTHDRRLKGLFELLTVLAILAPELGLDADALIAARNMLFPDGPSMTQRKYAEEAAEVELVAGRLTAEAKALLSDIKVHGKSLWSIVDRWLDAARELAVLEGQREQIEAKLSKERADRPRERDARNAWIEVVGMIRRATQAHKELAPEDVAVIFQRLSGYESGVDKGEDSGPADAADDDDDDDGGAPPPAAP